MPTEHPLAIAAGARAARCSAASATALWVALILASFLALVAGVYRLGRIAFTPLVGAIAAAAAADPLRLRVPGRARLHRHPVHGAGRVGGGAGGARARGAARRCSLLLALAGLLRPEAWLLAGAVLAVGGLEGDLAGARRATPRWPRSARCVWAATDCARHRRPAVLAALHEQLGRGARPPAHAVASCRRRCRSSSPNLVKLPVLVAAVIGLGLAIAIAPAARGDAARAAGRGHRHVRR